jgi:hypothetical protein
VELEGAAIESPGSVSGAPKINSMNFLYRNRRAVSVENEHLQVIVTVEGGHIAAIVHKPDGLNPLWTPPWPSIEPSRYDPVQNVEYGSSGEAFLLSGIMGHSICLDTYGNPSPEEAAAGMPVHGEAAVAPYTIRVSPGRLSLQGILPLAQLLFRREIQLSKNSRVVLVRESIENLSSCDKPIAWTQHVTLGPPFLERGRTEFRTCVTQSKVIDEDFTGGLGMQKTGAEFRGLLCPRKDGGIIDLSVYPSDTMSGGFTTHLLDPQSEHAYFLAWSPTARVVFGYAWKRAEFPWLCRWEENRLRSDPPWNGQTLTCGMEFGVSPILESRRGMVERGTLFGERTFRWVPAKGQVHADYCAFLDVSESIPSEVIWDGAATVRFS